MTPTEGLSWSQPEERTEVLNLAGCLLAFFSLVLAAGGCGFACKGLFFAAGLLAIPALIAGAQVHMHIHSSRRSAPSLRPLLGSVTMLGLASLCVACLAVSAYAF